MNVRTIPVEVTIDADSDGDARLIIQHRLGGDDRVKRYSFDRGVTRELASVWRPISSAPKDRKVLGLEADLDYAFTAEWSNIGECWMNLTADEKSTKISHWMPQPPL